MNQGISRRTVLKGFGAAVALPWLEAFASAAPAAATKATAPVRAAFLYVPNGIWMSSWTPAEVGKEFKLSETLEPLAPFRKYVNVLSGLTLDKARPNGDGPGDHARAQASFLTGRQARKTNGADIRIGQSADQWIAQSIGDQTKFSSLELGIERGQAAGNCDSGYSCAYQSNFSWRGENTPNAKEVDPRQVFDRLFGRGGKEKDENRAQRDMYNKSILDFVAEDAKSLEKELGTTDKAQAGRVPDGGPGNRGADRAGEAGEGIRNVLQAGHADSHGDSKRSARAYSPDVRSDGAGLPGRPDAGGDITFRE